MLHVAERKQIYALFAQVFSYPDGELLALLEQASTRTTLQRLAAREELAPWPETSLVDLETAYTDLFINRFGGAPAPPYGSVYLEQARQLMGQTSLHVAEAYRGQGLVLESGGEPPDFLPTELEFCYHLVQLEESALNRGDLAAARTATGQQAAFGRALLFPWIPVFCSRLAGETSSHTVYLLAGRALENFCRQEQDWLERRP